MRRTLLILLLGCLLPAHSAEKTFYLLNREQGLSGHHVYQLMQLNDGRMVVNTESHVCLYDGVSFRSVPKDTALRSCLPGYLEQNRLYVDRLQRLWVKDYQQVVCLDLRTLRFLPRPIRLLAPSPAGETDGRENVEDFCVDGTGRIWTVHHTKVCRQDDGLTLHVPTAGRIQEVQADSSRVYVFTSDGSAHLFDIGQGSHLGSCRAYGDEEAQRVDRVSMLVRGSDGMFYQTRTGFGGSVFLSFNPATCQWQRLLDCDYPLHTPIVTSGQRAYVSCPYGYWEFNLKTGERQLLRHLRLPDGSTLDTGFNTICQDREGGIWLGSYDLGVFYSSPLSSIFDTSEQPVRLTPVLTAAYVHGREIGIGDCGLTVDVAYADTLTLAHSDNALSLRFSAMKFVHPRHIYY